MLVVTTDTIHGWDVQRVCGEALGVHVRAGNDPTSPADGRAAAVARMLEHVRAKGGNAVVGLRLDTSTLGDGRVEICAYGTAVVAAPADEGARQTATALGYGQPGAAEDAAQAEPPAEPEQQPAPPPHDPYQQPQPQQPWGQQQPYGYPPQQYPQQGYPPQQYPQQQPYPQQYPPGYPGPQ